MFKKLFFFFIFLKTFISFSQEIVNSTPIELKKNIQVFQVVNDSMKQITMFMANQNRIKAIRLDDKMKFIDSISTQRPEKSYSKMIGNIGSINKTSLFWESSNQKKIFVQIFDFKNNKIVNKDIDVECKNEVYLQNFSIGNKFIILNILKKSNIFKLYIFDNEGNLERKDIDLSAIKFYHRNNLYAIFEEAFLPFETYFTLVKINSNSPNSLVNTVNKRKCYTINNQIIITLDGNINYTQIITLDLEKFTASEKTILNTHADKFSQDDYDVKSNSFLTATKLYQIKSTTDKFFLTMKDLNGNLLNEYSATEETTIDFKNSEINQKGTVFGNGKKTLETSSQFLRKLNKLNSGISCYQLGENTLLTLGGVSPDKQKASQSILTHYGLMGAIVYYSAFYNPTADDFIAYSDRKVVKIEGLFDKDGNHIQGDLQPLAFDKINKFLEENKVSAQTLYKLEGSYFLGYYDKNAKQFIIRKFVD